MPTPESAAFLAKKPTVPPTFDGVDYDDTKRLKQAQDAIIREQWVRVMMGRLVREELSKCYYREGVNHLEKCGHLRGGYKASDTPWLFSLGAELFNNRMRLRHAMMLLQSFADFVILAPERYLQLLSENRVQGYLFEQQNHFANQPKQ